MGKVNIFSKEALNDEGDSFLVEIKCDYENLLTNLRNNFYNDAAFSIEVFIGSRHYLCGDIIFNVNRRFAHVTILSFCVRSKRVGEGTILLRCLIESLGCLYDKLLSDGFDVQFEKIKGKLAIGDKKNGNWDASIPFYDNFAKINDININFYKDNYLVTSDELLNTEIDSASRVYFEYILNE